VPQVLQPRLLRNFSSDIAKQFRGQAIAMQSSFAESAAQCGERDRIFDNRLNVPVVRKILEIYFE
jgi:hypothetical protein